VAGAAIARVGGVLIPTAGASTAAADAVLNSAGVSATVDEMYVVKSAAAGTSVPVVIFVLIGLVAVAGLVLLGVAASQKSKTGPAPAKKAAPAAAGTGAGGATGATGAASSTTETPGGS
jgi:hypothetical protein